MFGGIYKFIFVFLFITFTLAAYNQTLGKFSANLSAISHCSKQSIENWSCKLCKTTPNIIKLTYLHNKQLDIVGFTGYVPDSNQIVVSFRGSVSVENWIEDFTFEEVVYNRCKNCKIHLGFYLDFEAIRAQLFDAVNQLIQVYSTSTIFVTGHSLGGALALISALELQLKFNRVGALYALGCPRVGESNFAQYFNMKISQKYRLIHNRDIVPHVPFQAMGFHHTVYEVFYNEQFSQYKVCDSTGQDKSCSNKFFPQYSGSDHDLYWVKMDDTIC